jgi:hypothetical protein
MLIIREKQIQALENGAVDEMVTEISIILHREHPETVRFLPEDLLRKRIAGGIEKARLYEFERKRDLSLFVILMFEIAPGFSEEPDVYDILTDERIVPNSKLDLIIDERFEHVLAKARFYHDDKDWESLGHNASRRPA